MRSPVHLFSIGVALSIIYASGCASTQQFVPFPDQSVEIEDENKARIYLMRPTSFGGALELRVHDGGRAIGATGAHGYLCWEREPGKTMLKSDGENNPSLELEVEKGKVYYVLQRLIWGFMSANVLLEVAGPQQGKESLLECSPPQGQVAQR